jgi:hypothetical protein
MQAAAEKNGSQTWRSQEKLFVYISTKLLYISSPHPLTAALRKVSWYKFGCGEFENVDLIIFCRFSATP